MSDGSLPHGFARGFHWEHGYSGPHAKREAERVRSVAGGELVHCDDAETDLNSLRNPVSSRQTKTESISQVDLDDSLGTPTETEGFPSFEEIGYKGAIEIMTKAGFDYVAAGSGRKKAQVKKAWTAFTEQQ